MAKKATNNKKQKSFEETLFIDARKIGSMISRTQKELYADDIAAIGNANYAWILHMVSKLSEHGLAGFVLANGSMNTNTTGEGAIRQKMVENDLVEAILVLPMRMFYTTDISVALWILNKNKKAKTVEHGDISRHYRDCEGEVLFMDLRKWGEPFEKKYIQFSDGHIQDVAKTYHTWQQTIAESEYGNIPEYYYSANIDEWPNIFFLIVSA